MNARDRLRQYLEQRRELGETEFVLDGLPIADAMRLLGLRGDEASAGAQKRPESSARKAAELAGESGDWRTALRSIGAEKPASSRRTIDAEQRPGAPQSTGTEPPRDVPEKVGRLEMPTQPVGDATSEPPAAPQPGIAVGHPIASLAAGALAALDSIDAVARAVGTCQLCALHAGAKNPVPGEGNPHAGFVCVGEAPGATEDETGRPFVGQAGSLLTKILAAVGFTREDVFICNVLKHRPPGNRNPSPEEIRACSPYLLRQLELLQPRVILALGTFAAQTLLQTTQSIGKLRGQLHRFYGVPLIVTYHPAALLRNPSWKRPTWEDVQLARRIFDNAARGA
ncbi:MAG TPA: uracil-DNA glycosylase [Gemmatimonadaceae bacterium]|nr:uracil-DNA glycosylase [Gemmatimonadaceae bacterium]